MSRPTGSGNTARRDGKVVRIAAGQGFWGDWLEAPVRQVQGGPIDYLMMDYLAEVTMSIMQKQKTRDPKMGYARDFVPLMERILPDVVAKGIRVTSNAGGVNPLGCAEAVLAVARKLGLEGKVRVGLVTGDDILARLDELIASGHELRDMETGRPLSDVRDRVLSANAYLGMGPIVEALRGGANVVVTGRVTDTGLTLGPMFHEFGWAADDWDKVAAGTVAGHIIECGAQSSGGNLLKDWRKVKGMADPGFPIVEAHPDGTFVVTKHPGTGGVVSVASVTEQLVYEMGDPHCYITPDGIADFTTIRLRQAGRDRVAASGIRGGPKTDKLKVSIAYFYGYKAVGTLVYSWPDAYEKAKAADKILRQRLADLGLEFEQILTEFVGADATHGPLAGRPDPEAPEVQLRIGVRAREKAPVERFTREIAPLVLTGPPSVTGFAGGRPAVEEIVAYWPALIDRTAIEPGVRVEILEA
ncbi:MAG TPA: acyclic terpene utilization AtuA family protein [Gemmatimonadales bacterium]|nr:acyclic terpene utilization AtuA family protein [Gemmatimonadales bacterium]